MIKMLSLIFCLLYPHALYADKPYDWQVNFQEAASPIMLELQSLHNFLLIIIAAIVIFVSSLLIYVMIRFSAKRNPIPAKFTHNIAVEIVWTVIPVIILVIIAIPSFKVLKNTEHIPTPDLTIKVVGSQWYWSYSYPDHGNIEFDSNVIQDKDLKPGQLRLLEVDNRIIVPEGAVVKFLITASDVMHSFAVPSLGIKTDAIPGRVNHTWTKIDKKGVYYGQCSELCGVNHGFMPIAIEVVSKEEFDTWVKSKKENTIKN